MAIVQLAINYFEWIIGMALCSSQYERQELSGSVYDHHLMQTLTAQ